MPDSNFAWHESPIPHGTQKRARKKLARGILRLAEFRQKRKAGIAIAHHRNAQTSLAFVLLPDLGPCKKMIGFQSSPFGQIFREYAGNQALVQFLGPRGCNGRFGRLYEADFEVLASFVFSLRNKERKNILLFPVIDVPHFCCMPAKRKYPLQTVNKNFRFAFRYIPGMISGPQSAKYRRALATFLQVAECLKQFTVWRGLLSCGDKFNRNAPHRTVKISG